MTQTLSQMLPILQFMASTGAGILASLLFATLRHRYPLPAAVPASSVIRLLLHLLYAPRWSRLGVIVLAGLIAIPFALVIALINGQAPLPIVDALVAALISQVWHALTALSGDVIIDVPVSDEDNESLEDWFKRHGWEPADGSDVDGAQRE